MVDFKKIMQEKRAIHQAAKFNQTGKIDVVGAVKKLFFSNETFSAGVFKSDDGQEFKFSVEGELRVGERIQLIGEWSNHPKYGPQVEKADYFYDTKPTKAALIEYLARNEAFSGVGPARAKKIVDAIAELGDFETVIQDKSHKEISEAAGVPITIIEVLVDEWLSQAGVNRVKANLAEFGVTPGQAKKLYERFGSGVIKTIKENPYFLIGKIKGYAFKKVDAIAIAAGIDKNKPERIKAGILHTMKEERDGPGHTYCDGRSLVLKSLELLVLDGLDCMELIASTIMQLEDENLIHGERIREGKRLFWLPSLWQAEQLVLQKIEDSKGSSGPLDETEENLSRIASSHCETLNDGQLAATVSALGNSLSVITGGAGSGKTFVIGTICDLICQSGDYTEDDIALCAPTGKAAKRITESVGLPAQTIHQLLEPKFSDDSSDDQKFSFTRDESNCLEAAIVIVDESSMIDVVLFASLLRAIDLRTTTVVLVGDDNQLPPVGAGAVLRDLITFDLVPIVKLTEIHRNAGVLERNINAVLSGKVIKSVDRKEGETTCPPWTVLSQFKEKEDVAVFIEKLFKNHLSKLTRKVMTAEGLIERPIDPIWDVQLLTAMHNGAAGTKNLNRILQQIACEREGRAVPEINAKTGLAPVTVGDKVIQTKNDYQEGVMNGTMGVVTERDPKTGELKIDFDGVGLVELSGPKNISLAYAMTVHKSQGSEYPVVIYICHKSQNIMLHKGLFYTAVSRARESVVIVGDRWGISECAKRIRTDKRRTLLSVQEDDLQVIVENQKCAYDVVKRKESKK